MKKVYISPEYCVYKLSNDVIMDSVQGNDPYAEGSNPWGISTTGFMD